MGQQITRIPMVQRTSKMFQIFCLFFTLQRMFTAMESGNLKAWKKA